MADAAVMSDLELAALMCSKLCHDVIGPVGAISNGFEILEDENDEYNPQQTASNIEDLVGADGDGAFAVFSVVGTANNINIRDFLGDLCVPDLYAATGAVAWGNPEYPWLTGGSLVPYSLESQAFADYLVENQPDANARQGEHGQRRALSDPAAESQDRVATLRRQLDSKFLRVFHFQSPWAEITGF